MVVPKKRLCTHNKGVYWLSGYKDERRRDWKNDVNNQNDNSKWQLFICEFVKANDCWSCC